MTMTKKALLVFAVAFGVCTGWCAELAAKPNVLVIYIDDMGWGDLGCYGGALAPTPRIDSIAAQGIRFDNGYVSSPVCGPSRVGLLTGRYPQHTGHDSNTTAKNPTSKLVLTEVTMAQRMKAGGYATGIIGKWHLGGGEAYLPPARGFDYAYGTISNPAEKTDGYHMFEGGGAADDPAEFPLTMPEYRKRALQFVEDNRDKPWLLYFSPNSVHGPLVASDKYLKAFDHLDNKRKAYAAMIAELDDAVGDLMDRLRSLGLEENTLIFVLSDNGGACKEADMGGLSGKKWLLWEGGIRVPFIAAWKGRIPPGRVSSEPVVQLDILPTALAAAGMENKPEWGLDGVNLLPMLEGKKALDERTLYWRFGTQYAVRHGDWKIVSAAYDEPPRLINLADDPAEDHDLSAQHPEKMEELQKQWDRWNATMPPPRWKDFRWNRPGEEKDASKFKLIRKKKD
ncbi:Arylsulfatase [Pontiella desulfatans]|uniref:Arylsulfatase n=1 Tax=Pontiella desulfatans TaxID=2750659 RepID=A0A6C2U0I9_PONDE|nr:sulfatase-like hydrolase/transferase [Pontiella desulfatans]SPS73741.1 sulfatase S1_19 [Kiritimatiellales bacterium]VGO13111.1 Arylsulfatase [Pontiella desulfatans]